MRRLAGWLALLFVLAVAAVAVLLVLRHEGSDPVVAPDVRRPAPPLRAETAPESAKAAPALDLSPPPRRVPPPDAPAEASEAGAGGGRILVRVIDAGEAPVESALVRLVERRDPERTITRGRTDGAGEVVLRYDAWGPNRWLRVVHRDYLPAQVFVAPTHAERTLVLTPGAPLEVLVREEGSGRPLPGLEIVVTDPDRMEMYRSTTGEEGIVRMHVQSPEDGSDPNPQVRGGEADRACREVERRFGPYGGRVVLECARRGHVFGEVVDASGQPVADAEVLLVPAIASEIGELAGTPQVLLGLSRRRETRRTDAEGRFRFASLRRSFFRVQAIAPAGEDVISEPIELDPAAGYDDARFVRLVVAGPTTSLRVRVADRDGPVGGVGVYPFVDENHMAVRGSGEFGLAFPADRTDENGEILFRPLRPRSYRIALGVEGSAISWHDVVAEAGTETLVELPFEAGLAVEGVVVDRAGDPVSGADVVFTTENDVRVDTSTDVEGRFRLRRLPELPGRVVASKGGTSGFDAELGQGVVDGVRPGGQPLRIVLPPPARLRGRLEAEDPESLAGKRTYARVTVHVEGERVDGWVGIGRHGSFDLALARAGSVRVEIEVSGRRWTAGPVLATAGERVDLGVLPLDGGTVIGIVRDPHGNPVSTIVEYVPEGGAAFASPPAQARSDYSGRFELVGLAPGAGYVRTRPGERLAGIVPAHPDGPVAELRIHPPATIRGRIPRVDSEWRRHEIYVMLDERVDSRAGYRARLDDEGRFELQVAPGRYRVGPMVLGSLARSGLDIPREDRDGIRIQVAPGETRTVEIGSR